MAACLLTRHVALGLVLAILLDLWIRGRVEDGPGGRDGLGLPGLPLDRLGRGRGGSGAPRRVCLPREAPISRRGSVAQGTFYLQRIPDQITGPLVEVATTIRPLLGGRGRGEPLGLPRDGRDLDRLGTCVTPAATTAGRI